MGFNLCGVFYFLQRLKNRYPSVRNNSIRCQLHQWDKYVPSLRQPRMGQDQIFHVQNPIIIQENINVQGPGPLETVLWRPAWDSKALAHSNKDSGDKSVRNSATW